MFHTYTKLASRLSSGHEAVHAQLEAPVILYVHHTSQKAGLFRSGSSLPCYYQRPNYVVYTHTQIKLSTLQVVHKWQQLHPSFPLLSSDFLFCFPKFFLVFFPIGYFTTLFLSQLRGPSRKQWAASVYVNFIDITRLMFIRPTAISLFCNLKYRSSACGSIFIYNPLLQNGYKLCIFPAGYCDSVPHKGEQFDCEHLYRVRRVCGDSCMGASSLRRRIATEISPISLAAVDQEPLPWNATSRKLMPSSQKTMKGDG
jgi:hypothetical protein